MSLPANYDDEFNYTIGTVPETGTPYDTTVPVDTTDTTTTYTPPGGGNPTGSANDPSKFGDAFVYDPKTGLYTQTLYDGSTIVQDANGNIVNSSGSVLDSGGSGVAGAGGAGKSIFDFASALPAQAWNAIKSAFTKKDANGNDVTDWKALAAAGGGIAGLASNLMNKNNPAPLTGYQDGIPTYTAVQQQVPGTYDPTRRPGSSGQRYLTDMKYAAPSDAAAAQTTAGEQATGLAGLNAANPAMQKRPVVTAPAPVTPTTTTAAPASSVIDRLAPTAKGLESLVNPPEMGGPVSDGAGGIVYRSDFGGGGQPNPQTGNLGNDVLEDPEVTAKFAALRAAGMGPSLVNPPTQTPPPPPQQPQEINYASGGGITALKRGNYLSGSTDGMADKLPANIDGNQEARLSHGEFVIPADVVSHLGNGNSEAGADRLYSMMDKIRKARTGTKKQGKQINPNKFLPGGSVGYAKGGIASFAAGDLVTGTDPSNVIGKESNLSNWAGDYVTNMLGKGQALADQPYQGYSGPLTAGASAGQTAAFQGAAGLNVPTGQMGAFTPQTFTADQAQNYMNPYLSAALNPQMEEMRRQSQLNLQPNMAKLTQAGGYGGSRQALLQSESNRNLQTQQNAALGQGYQTAFDKAMGQFNTEQNRGLEAQSATNAYGLQALSKQAELGGQQRDIEQQGITADRAQFEEEKQDPYKKLTFQQSLLQGLPVQAQSNQYAQPSLLNSLAGGVTTIASLYDTLFPAAKTTTTAAGK